MDLFCILGIGTGISLQLRLMRGVLSNANYLKISLWRYSAPWWTSSRFQSNTEIYEFDPFNTVYSKTILILFITQTFSNATSLLDNNLFFVEKTGHSFKHEPLRAAKNISEGPQGRVLAKR